MAPILDREELIVPAICLYEVFKWVLIHRDEPDAFTASADMQQGLVVSIDANIAMGAARLSAELRLPMADSLVLATARACDATLWTQDDDFKDLPAVRYKSRRP